MTDKLLQVGSMALVSMEYNQALELRHKGVAVQGMVSHSSDIESALIHR